MKVRRERPDMANSEILGIKHMCNNISNKAGCGREQEIIRYFYSIYLFLSFDKNVWTKLKINF